MSKTVYVVCSVSEDSYVNVEGVYTTYAKADEVVTELQESDPNIEWDAVSAVLD